VTPQNLQDQLLRDEGLKLMPYTDVTSHITIGVGRNLTDIGITNAEAMYLLANDIGRAETRVNAALPWAADIDPVRRCVLYNMAFNLGIAGLLQFRNFLDYVQKQQCSLAAHEMLDSRWAEQVGPRAQRLAKQLEEGVWY
jgi:lysozyme